jgi:cytochrome c oxidase assembly protein subunit 15
MVVGALLVFQLVWASWMGKEGRQEVGVHLGWPWLLFVWVLVQGAFGAWTVTLKLYPAVVTMHLLLGLGLLALLAIQAQTLPTPSHGGGWLAPPAQKRVHATLAGLAALCLVQMALGGWVSTNYAVLACRDFPLCQGQVWPPMQWTEGFALLRHLGHTSSGALLPFEALTAIHVAHRLFALVVVGAMVWVGLVLYRCGVQTQGADRYPLRRWGLALWGLAAWQVGTGVSNVVLGWPLLAALGHTAGAAALVVVLGTLAGRCWGMARLQAQAHSPQTQPASGLSLHTMRHD